MIVHLNRSQPQQARVLPLRRIRSVQKYVRVAQGGRSWDIRRTAAVILSRIGAARDWQLRVRSVFVDTSCIR